MHKRSLLTSTNHSLAFTAEGKISKSCTCLSWSGATRWSWFCDTCIVVQWFIIYGYFNIKKLNEFRSKCYVSASYRSCGFISLKLFLKMFTLSGMTGRSKTTNSVVSYRSDSYFTDNWSQRVSSCSKDRHFEIQISTRYPSRLGASIRPGQTSRLVLRARTVRIWPGVP